MRSIVGNRYAKALLRVIQGEPTASFEKLQPILELFKNDSIAKVLKNPAVNVDLKKQVMDNVSSQLGLDKNLKSFLNVVVESGRINIFPEILDSFEDLANKAQKSQKAELITAVEINDADAQKIQDKIEQQLSLKLTFTKKVDSSILGGFIVNIGQKQIDQSVRRTLQNMMKTVEKDI